MLQIHKQLHTCTGQPEGIYTRAKPIIYSGTSEKGHIMDKINSAVLSFIERLSFFFLGSQCTKTIGHVIFGTSNNVLYREVILFLFRFSMY